MRHNAEDRVTTSTMNKWGGSARLILQGGRQDRLHLGPDAKIESAAIEGRRPMGSRRHGSEPWIDLVDGTDYSCSLWMSSHRSSALCRISRYLLHPISLCETSCLIYGCTPRLSESHTGTTAGLPPKREPGAKPPGERQTFRM